MLCVTANTKPYWDDILGPSSADPKAVMKTAKKLPAADVTKASDLNVADWIDEGIRNAQTVVCVSPIALGTGPFTISSKYEKAAKVLAKKEVALAGARLANLLNLELK